MMMKILKEKRFTSVESSVTFVTVVTNGDDGIETAWKRHTWRNSDRVLTCILGCIGVLIYSYVDTNRSKT